MDKVFLEIGGDGKPTGSVLEGDNCSFRHDINKRAKLTQPNPSPSSFMQQNERNESRTRSPRGKSPSGSNCVNYSIWNSKHSAKYVYHTGTLASSIARAGTSCETERRTTRNLSNTLWISSRFPITTSRKGDPTGTVTGKSQGITSTTSRIRSRRNARRGTSWVSTTGSSAMRSSARICLTLVALKKYVVRWTNWRTKTTRTTSLKKKFECKETIGGYARTQLVPIRCQLGIDLTSSKHCQPCDSSKTKRIQLISKDGKALPHLGGTDKNPGGILLVSITTRMDLALLDQGILLKSDRANYSRYDYHN